ncbi:uncharacterized protein [Montipora capricornis]|uniref:uncharacterized protein n=1 Tax=Montipora capricornis TaxID=246305 RepID=UPI0035F10E6C
MENIGSAINYVSLGDYMVSLDLKDAYFSVPIHPLDRKLLRFFWKGQRFEFTCLPFGYSLAPRVFTKILKPFAAIWRSKGIRISIYIDDILIIASSVKQAATLLAVIRNSLESLGFLVNIEKSHVTLTTRITYLGFEIDSVAMKLFLPISKISRIIQSCKNLLQNSNPTIREIAHVAGFIVSALPAVSATASTVATVGGSASSTTQPGVPPSEVQDEASRLGCVRKSLSDKGISSQATNLICASWTTGTEEQYQAVWKKWRGWCRERNVDSLQAHVSQVLNFLADCFGEGLSYSVKGTLNSYRSALSSTLCPRDGTTVGCDPLVSRLLKGIYNLRPPLPRYSSTWDVSVLTQYLGTLFPLNSLSLKQLTLKTVSLCALCSAGRSQTLGALSIINAYITHTCNLRNPTDFRMFISFVKPHRAVSPATISRWIKTVLSDAGIDTSIFKAHSVRGAATSAAYNKGVPVENILKLANWSNESTFRRFYLRSAEPGKRTHRVIESLKTMSCKSKINQLIRAEQICAVNERSSSYHTSSRRWWNTVNMIIGRQARNAPVSSTIDPKTINLYFQSIKIDYQYSSPKVLSIPDGTRIPTIEGAHCMEVSEYIKVHCSGSR